MKNLFNQMKTGLSMVMVLTLFVTQFSSLLFQAPKTYALGNFTTNELVANQVEILSSTGTQSQTIVTVINPVIEWYAIDIDNCVITIYNNSGAFSDYDCTDGVGEINIFGNPGMPFLASEFAAITYSGYSAQFTGTESFILTHSDTPPINFNVPIFTVSGSFLSTSILVLWAAPVVGTAAVAQVVEFIPTLPMLEDTFQITLDGNNFATTVVSWNTIQNIVETLQRWTNFIPAVNCTEDDVKITCTAAVTGVEFTYDAQVLDQTPPVVTLAGPTPINLILGSIYTEQGAKWSDGNDGTGTILMPTSGSVDAGTLWTYILKYTYVDGAGNTGNTVTRTVNVYRPLDGGAYIDLPTPTHGSQNQTTIPDTNTETNIDLNDLLNPTIDSSNCFSQNDKRVIDQGNGVSLNFMKAQQLLLNFDLTSIPGTKDYNPERSLTRAEAAKFLSLFAQNILCRETTKTYPAGLFKDLGQTDAGLQSYIKLSYEYEIFRGDVGGMFRPNDIISRDELIAVIVRLVTNEYDNVQGADRAANYKATLNSNTSIPLTSVKRGNTAEVIYDLYRNNDYSMDADLGFVLR